MWYANVMSEQVCGMCMSDLMSQRSNRGSRCSSMSSVILNLDEPDVSSTETRAKKKAKATGSKKKKTKVRSRSASTVRVLNTINCIK